MGYKWILDGATIFGGRITHTWSFGVDNTLVLECDGVQATNKIARALGLREIALGDEPALMIINRYDGGFYNPLKEGVYGS